MSPLDISDGLAIGLATAALAAVVVFGFVYTSRNRGDR